VLAHPEIAGEDPPRDALEAAADRLRTGMEDRTWPYEHMRRAAGFRRSKLPGDDLKLWLGAAGGLISMREQSGLEVEAESWLMALELGDCVGAILGLVRAGVGAPATPKDLVAYIGDCPEVEGEVDPDDATLVEGAFELILPAWQAADAIDPDRRLTPLGRWGLPRAVAWAWNGNLDDPSGRRYE